MRDRSRYARNREVMRERNRVRYNPEARREWHRARLAYLGSRTLAETIADRTRLRPDGVKRCRLCNLWLALTAFNSDRAQTDGLSTVCRPCNAAAVTRRKRRAAEKAWHALGIPVEVCFYCGAPAEYADHVLPRNLGGLDADNLLPACAPCNLSKSDTPLVWWAVRRFGENAADILDRVLAVLPEVGSPATRLVGTRRAKAPSPCPLAPEAGPPASLHAVPRERRRTRRGAL